MLRASQRFPQKGERIMQLNISSYTGLTSPLDLVQRILTAKAFVDIPPEDAAAEGDIILGGMTDEEKAIFTARRQTVFQLRELALNGIRTSGELSDAESKVMINEGETLDKWAEIINELLWTTIRTRFSEQLLENGRGEIALRPGFQVALPPADPDDGATESLMKAIGLLVGDGHEHNCDTCEKYDTCPLPFKQPRTQAPKVN